MNTAFASYGDGSGFPSALTCLNDGYGYGYQGGFLPRSVFELRIIEMVGSICEKQEWWNKVDDPKISAKWRQEMMDQLELDSFGEDAEYRKKLVDFAIAEAKWWADHDLYKNGPVRPSAVAGVFLRDDLDETLKTKLRMEIAEVRSRPAVGSTSEDRHPGTPQIVDLVHPSLYAYEQGKTMVLPNDGAEVAAMPQWDSFLGKEGVIEHENTDNNNNMTLSRFGSRTGLQWLPAEFRVTADGKRCEINSYINSLHPKQHADLNKSISDLFCYCVPLLEEVLAEAGEHNHKASPRTVVRERNVRIPVQDIWDVVKVDQGQEGEDNDEDDAETEDEDETKVFRHPPVPEFEAPPAYTKEKANVNLRDRPLQVIVKIASMELAPGEAYDGGVWHVEGTLGERIVATVCCYLECDNVTGGELAFRTSVSEPYYEQNDEEGVSRMYNLRNDHPLVQDAGACATLEGRVLAWPNTKQHRVHPVSLVDPERPGKRTICCFFLVDPTLRIRSTATVPPQQLAWVTESVNAVLAPAGMSEVALQNQVSQLLSSGHLLTYEAACERRSRLMDERRAPEEGSYENYIVRNFSLCEH